jgi:hypothetical protein
MKRNLKKKLKTIIQENYSEIIDDGIDNKQHVEELFDKVLNSLPDTSSKDTARPQKKLHLRIAVIAVCACIVFFSSIILASNPEARAFTFNIQNAFNKILNIGNNEAGTTNITNYYSDFSEIEPVIANKLPKFDWMPEGYALKSIQISEFHDDIMTASISYIKNQSDYIDITINPYSDSDGYAYLNDSDYQLVEINNVQTAISIDRPYAAKFFYHGSFLVSISTSEDKDILINIIENIK